MATTPGAAATERRVSPLLFGTVLFLASELLFFGSLFAAYFALRAQTVTWPPEGVQLDVVVPAIGTVLLVLSSVTFQVGLVAGERGRRSGLRAWIAATLLLGIVFLGVQIWDYTRLDFDVSSHAYGTIFYAMTGFHGLHVAAGIVLMLVILGRLAQGAYQDGRVESVHAIGYYWHFVDVVWIALFATLYLLR
ncbi:MAG TPA: heme-copper oxidase subunit III [Actinomycetota bacterium]|nr:heme-copper oxidase subunit III [Actinomycetota bacterium]